MAIYGSEMAGEMEFHVVLLFDVIPGTLFGMFSSLDPKNNCQQKKHGKGSTFRRRGFLVSSEALRLLHTEMLIRVQ